jgi:hypothetical protein
VTTLKPRRFNLFVMRLTSFAGGLAGLLLVFGASGATAQTQPPPPDPPSIKVGATIFADYTVTTEPKGTDVDGNEFTPNSFNIGRAYLNITGNISKLVAFRVTPDIVRESGAGSSSAGSYVYRLKYAYAQFNLDEWTGRGSFARFGMQPTPWIDFVDSVYRYRFQGPTLEDREGILSSSDVGATFRYTLPASYGEVHGGFYNGDNYNRAEANDQKAFMVRGTVRPLPQHALLRGLRVTGFIDVDAYVANAERERRVLGVTYEHSFVHAGFNYLSTTDQVRAAAPELDGHGYSIWATPKTAKGHGWEGLLRFDHLMQDQAVGSTEGERNRTIAGIAYWFPRQGAVSAAILFDYEHVDNRGYLPVRTDERRWAVHTLIGF